MTFLSSILGVDAFSLKGVDSRHFQICEPYGVLPLHSHHSTKTAETAAEYLNESVWLCSNKTVYETGEPGWI